MSTILHTESNKTFEVLKSLYITLKAINYVLPNISYEYLSTFVKKIKKNLSTSICYPQF